MGSFVAILNPDDAATDGRLLRAMIDGSPYGGPNDVRVWTSDGIAIGCAPLRTRHRRPDVSMISLDARHSVVMDGRLDDRAALVRSLESDSDRHLESASDVELLRAAYERWGVDCVTHLLGDFSFCVWDIEQRRLWCARDQLGVKPLYFARVGASLVVSNVLRSIRRHPGVSDRFDDEAIGDFLLFGACLEQARTSFADVARLPPGHSMIGSPADSNPRINRYWSLDPGEELRYRDPHEYVEHYSSTLETVVGDRLRGGPIGVLMSGGLDSSSVAATAADLSDRASTPVAIRAYTAVYDTVAADEERHYSALVARAIGIEIEHHAVDSYQWFDRWNTGLLPPEPSTEPMTAMMADLLDHISLRGDVVLTGDGGDPALLPSTSLSLIRHTSVGSLASGLWRSAWKTRTMPPLGLRSLVRGWVSSPTSVPQWLAESLTRRWDPEARVAEIARRRAPVRHPRGAAISAVVDPWWTSMFETYDPGATLRPVELRYPLFDVRLLSLALRLPTHPWCINKDIVRSAMRGRLPEEILVRPKSPLPVDFQHVHGRWTVTQAAEAIEAAPALAGFVDLHKFRARVSSEHLLTEDEPGTWAVVALATWLRCAAGATVGA